eukprot:NODE_2249_length_1466_cov_96.630678_g2137_i0.p1 GENE.NODE_2249_length_1466_cov_96.630678_g2137_i0~~NODE_2249_length_1466_cov_96.630678_g2137_i0.p1  ORF type:complete len:424 (-),score=52.18 NODE_2249_length_1466_cov_96.630678_g2137_i0:65-1336(-)
MSRHALLYGLAALVIILLVVLVAHKNRLATTPQNKAIAGKREKDLRSPVESLGSPDSTDTSDESEDSPQVTHGGGGDMDGLPQTAHDGAHTTALDITNIAPASGSNVTVKITSSRVWCEQLRASHPDLIITVGPEHKRRKPGLDIHFQGEFGYEIGLVIPYCHWLLKRGLLQATVSAGGTAPFYWFSPCHVESPRSKRINTGYDEVHAKYWGHRWAPPTYWQFGEMFDFQFSKPILIIHNKYSSEWNPSKRAFGPPLNFLPVNILDCLFGALSPHYQIVYFRPQSGDLLGDDQEIHRFRDYELIAANYSRSVVTFADLLKTHNSSYNKLQLAVHAKCRHFISIQGGSSYLASYFGGTNMILHRHGGGEWGHKYQAYFKLFPRLSHARVLAFRHYAPLLRKIRDIYLPAGTTLQCSNLDGGRII